jgi:hypothetical protein
MSCTGDQDSPGGRLQVACVVALLFGVGGCSYSLEQRIEALQASGYNIEPHAPESRPAGPRKRSRTRVESRSLQAGSIGSVGSESRSLHTGSIGSAGSESRSLHTGSTGNDSRSLHTGSIGSVGSDSRRLHPGNIESVGSQIERWKPVPAEHKPTADQNSPEWVREQAEAAEKDRALDIKIRSICRGC